MNDPIKTQPNAKSNPKLQADKPQDALLPNNLNPGQPSKFSYVIIGLITIVLTLVFLGGGYFLFLRTKWKLLSQVSLQLDKREKMLAYLKGDAKANHAALDSLLKDEAWHRLEGKIPNTDDISGLLEEISTQVESAGLTLMNFEEQKEMPLEFLMQIPIQLTVMGKYENLLQLIDGFSNLSRLVTVDALHLTTFSSETDHVILSATLLLSAYKGQPTGI